MLQEASSGIKVVRDWSCDHSSGDRQAQWLSGSKDHLSHEISDAFLLLDGEAVELGGSGCEAVEKVALWVGIAWEEKSLCETVPRDADGGLVLEELIANLELTIHMIIRA
jgi:hypothetical protein